MRQSSQSEKTVNIDCDYVHETDKAWLVRVEKPGQKKATKEWFPKSLVQYHQEGLNQWLEMSQNYAEEKGLV